LTDYTNRTVALILGAGSGSRAELGYNKLLYEAGGKTVIEYTLEKFSAYPVVLVAAPAEIQQFAIIAARYKNVEITEGGGQRSESVRRGLKYIKSCDMVIIHDGARPNVTPEIIAQAVDAAGSQGGAVVYVPCTDTVKEILPDRANTFDRGRLIQAQTPQVFDYGMICEALLTAGAGDYSDDSQIFEACFHKCAYITGSTANYKITTMADIKRFTAEHTGGYEILRIGNGYDIHRFALGRKLMLGGIEIPHYEGLTGHSDADAVIHALADSLLSAIGERDIGYYFPSADPQYADISGAEILARVMKLVRTRKFKVDNVSIVIITERPRMSEHILPMKRSLAGLLGIDGDSVGVTAKTNEGVDTIGDQKALAVHAVSLLTKLN
jgi:2-C-methyl-D-erythritol 2,4-cyclodiphosphate synthase/2-C-methyl-D-erythritol 4-phosphate cytidylyltransferase